MILKVQQLILGACVAATSIFQSKPTHIMENVSWMSCKSSDQTKVLAELSNYNAKNLIISMFTANCSLVFWATLILIHFLISALNHLKSLKSIFKVKSLFERFFIAYKRFSCYRF